MTAVQLQSGNEAWLSPTSFWMPSHVIESAWLEHGPFAMWVVDALRPAAIAELGTHSGFSYFAFCEAVERLGLPTRCFAVDTWEGDDHAGFYEESVFELVDRVNSERYNGFSDLVRRTFADAREVVPDGSLDLLHIDGRHGYEDVREDFETWLPKLSPRAVVLFHDTVERDHGFGVWRFWDEVRDAHPSFNFEHGHGLGVLGVGADQTPAMIRFFEAAAATPERIRSDYAALGAVVAQRYWDELDRAELRRTMYGALQRVESLEADDAQLRAELEAIRASLAYRIARRSGMIRTNR